MQARAANAISRPWRRATMPAPRRCSPPSTCSCTRDKSPCCRSR